MPTVERGGVTLYYETAGSGPTVALVGDAGYGAWQWGWQYAALAGPYRVVVFDHRGTGRSDTPAGPYTMETLVDDLEAVLRAVDVGRTHLVGAGLGGMVALGYAREYGRARRLGLLGTAAAGEAVDVLAGRDLETATGRSFQAAQSEAMDGIRAWREEEDADTAGWRAQAAAVAAFDARDWLHDVPAPALVCHGTADEVWPPSGGEALAAGLPRGEFVPFDGAGHLVWVEQSRVVNDRLVGFLGDL